ncbi:MAG: glycosyltransferase [Calditrichaceae bacterium]|nr:glycosyltransferase [Calditrichaceae bacterium]MBN2710254.1 glycosyltransferase [Calditrichaceae bacterium]RQV93877.1 MAG: glycosyltransferase [Calditrichota bacterium]
MNLLNRYYFSIIIPCFNRKDELVELLNSFKNIEFAKDRYEVLVIDDGSTDGSDQLVEEFRKDSDIPLHYFKQDNKGPGAARNLGMQKAKGDFFIFIDSDVTIPKSWLKSISDRLHIEKADAFGGPDTYRKDFSPLLKAINYSMTSFITTGGMRGKKGKKLAKFYPRSFNMGLNRDLYTKIGGFGNLRHGQDIEFSHRILKSGAKTIFIEDAPVYHKRRTNLRRFYKQVFNWGIARINLYKIDPGMMEFLHAAPALGTLLVLLIIVLAPFSEAIRIILLYGVLMSVLILLFSMIDAILKYKELKPALLLPLVMPAQIFGYGMGFIYNYIRRVILKKPEKVGFKKNYYK